ncbi:hypothetical protein QEN19_002264 [Hanseniaspora menglaensis]
MSEDITNSKNNGYNSTSVPSLLQKRTQLNSKITSNYIESESDIYTTTDDDTEYVNKENSPTTPETDNLEMMIHDNTFESMTLKKRVKVYFLENGDWRDIGTGYASGVKKISEDIDEKFVEAENQDDVEIFPYLLVVDEKLPEENIIMSRIEGEIEYQRQEETLIVWRDTTGKDIALSFEEISGCDHLCDFIKYIQNNIVPTISLIAIRGDLNNMDVDISNSKNNNVAELLAGPVALPVVKDDLSTSELIESLKIINDNLYQNFLKTSTQKFILEKDYLNCLVQNFICNSKKKDWQKLILISSILKSIMAYNEAYIVYRILENDLYENCLSILEYDLDTPTMKANYTELYISFKEQAQIKQEVWFNEETLKTLENSDDTSTDESGVAIDEEFSEAENCKFLVGQLARLTFLKDFVFARYVDDYPIIQEVLQDDQIQLLEFITKKLNILDRLVSNILNSGDDFETLSQNLKMFHECILMAKSALGNNTEESVDFLQKLVDIKIFEMLKYVFSIMSETSANPTSQHEELKTITTDIALAIIENDIMALKDDSGTISSLSAAFLADKKESEIKKEAALDEEENLYQSPVLVDIDLSLITVLSNLLIKDNCQYLKQQVLHALLALLNIEGSTGVEDFLTQSISKIEYKITEVIDDESDFCSEEENDEDDDYMLDEGESNGNVTLMGKSGALSMFMKQLNNIDNDAYEEDYDDITGEEHESVEEEEDDDFEDDEDLFVDEEDEKFYERELMSISEEPIFASTAKTNELIEKIKNKKETDYDMEPSDEDASDMPTTNKEDFSLDKFVAQFDNLQDSEDQYLENMEYQRELYGDSLGFSTTIRDKFLSQFYENVAPLLLNSIMNCFENDYKNNNLIHLFDVIKFMIADHTKASKPFILTQNPHILKNIAKILVLENSTFRIKIKCMKLLIAIVSLNDTDYIKFIVKKNLLDTTFTIFEQYGNTNGIVKSIVLDFFKLLTDMSDDKSNENAQQNFAIIGNYVFSRYMETVLAVTEDKEYSVLKNYVSLMNKKNVSDNNLICPKEKSSIIRTIEEESLDEDLI